MQRSSPSLPGNRSESSRVYRDKRAASTQGHGRYGASSAALTRRLRFSSFPKELSYHADELCRRAEVSRMSCSGQDHEAALRQDLDYLLGPPLRAYGGPRTAHDERRRM